MSSLNPLAALSNECPPTLHPWYKLEKTYAMGEQLEHFPLGYTLEKEAHVTWGRAHFLYTF